MSPIIGVIDSQKSGHLGPPTYVNDYEWIATQNGNGSSNTITFSSIPQTYKHLQFRGIIRDTRSGTTIDTCRWRANSDASNNYDYWGLDFTYGGSLTSFYGSDTQGIFTYSAAANATTNNTSSFVIDFLDYTNTSYYKSSRVLINANIYGNGEVASIGSTWKSTAAINRIDILNNASSAFTSATSISLYGLKV